MCNTNGCTGQCHRTYQCTSMHWSWTKAAVGLISFILLHKCLITQGFYGSLRDLHGFQEYF